MPIYTHIFACVEIQRYRKFDRSKKIQWDFFCYFELRFISILIFPPSIHKSEISITSRVSHFDQWHSFGISIHLNRFFSWTQLVCKLQVRTTCIHTCILYTCLHIYYLYTQMTTAYNKQARNKRKIYFCWPTENFISFIMYAAANVRLNHIEIFRSHHVTHFISMHVSATFIIFGVHGNWKNGTESVSLRIQK